MFASQFISKYINVYTCIDHSCTAVQSISCFLKLVCIWDDRVKHCRTSRLCCELMQQPVFRTRHLDIRFPRRRDKVPKIRRTGPQDKVNRFPGLVRRSGSKDEEIRFQNMVIRFPGLGDQVLRTRRLGSQAENTRFPA